MSTWMGTTVSFKDSTDESSGRAKKGSVFSNVATDTSHPQGHLQVDAVVEKC